MDAVVTRSRPSWIWALCGVFIVSGAHMHCSVRVCNFRFLPERLERDQILKNIEKYCKYCEYCEEILAPVRDIAKRQQPAGRTALLFAAGITACGSVIAKRRRVSRPFRASFRIGERDGAALNRILHYCTIAPSPIALPFQERILVHVSTSFHKALSIYHLHFIYIFFVFYLCFIQQVYFEGNPSIAIWRWDPWRYNKMFILNIYLLIHQRTVAMYMGQLHTTGTAVSLSLTSAFYALTGYAIYIYIFFSFVKCHKLK